MHERNNSQNLTSNQSITQSDNPHFGSRIPNKFTNSSHKLGKGVDVKQSEDGYRELSKQRNLAIPIQAID